MPKLVVYDESPSIPVETYECSFLKEDEFVTGPERAFVVTGYNPHTDGWCWTTQARNKNHALAKFAEATKGWRSHLHALDIEYGAGAVVNRIVYSMFADPTNIDPNGDDGDGFEICVGEVKEDGFVDSSAIQW